MDKQQLIDIISKHCENAGYVDVADAADEILNILEDTPLSKSIILTGSDDLSEYGEGHKLDAEIIKGVLIEKGFVNAGLNDAVRLWSGFSDSYAAGWLYLPEDTEEIFRCINPHITKTFKYED